MAWYADQSNTFCRIFNSGQEITKLSLTMRSNFDFESLGSIATEISSLKRGAAAAWYADQSNKKYWSLCKNIHKCERLGRRGCTPCRRTLYGMGVTMLATCSIPVGYCLLLKLYDISLMKLPLLIFTVYSPVKCAYNCSYMYHKFFSLPKLFIIGTIQGYGKLLTEEMGDFYHRLADILFMAVKNPSCVPSWHSVHLCSGHCRVPKYTIKNTYPNIHLSPCRLSGYWTMMQHSGLG